MPQKFVMATESTHWLLTLSCKDGPGIVHAISSAIVSADGNITESQQFTSEVCFPYQNIYIVDTSQDFRFLIDVAEQDTGRFFMRLQIRAPVTREDFEARIRPVADRFKMEWHLDVVGRKMRVSVSPEVHLTKS
jgi:formyltetrahydrofolate deformylase